MSSNKSFFAGTEEVFARISSLILTIIFFLIYILAVKEITLEWQSLSLVLFIFWFVYEILSITLFQFFRFFSASRDSSTPKVPSSVPTNPVIEDISKTKSNLDGTSL